MEEDAKHAHLRIHLVAGPSLYLHSAPYSRLVDVFALDGTLLFTRQLDPHAGHLLQLTDTRLSIVRERPR